MKSFCVPDNLLSNSLKKCIKLEGCNLVTPRHRDDFKEVQLFTIQIWLIWTWPSATGGHPQNDSPLKVICPLKFFKTIERTIETIVYCFEKQWSIVPLLIFFQQKARDYGVKEIILICIFSPQWPV